MGEATTSRVPPTASAHPAAWKFDYPIYHAGSRGAWRAWLETRARRIAKIVEDARPGRRARG